MESQGSALSVCVVSPEAPQAPYSLELLSTGRQVQPMPKPLLCPESFKYKSSENGVLNSYHPKTRITNQSMPLIAVFMKHGQVGLCEFETIRSTT